LNIKKKKSLTSLITRSEGQLLLVALILIILYCAILILTLYWHPETFQILIGMTATHIIFGRAAAMSFGYAMHLGPFLVFGINAWIETIMVFIFLPVFILSWRKLLSGGPLKGFLGRLTKTAEKHHKTVQKYGLLGLFVFVWFPFWMTGPLVGSIVGVLLGVPLWLNLTAVLFATYLATITWSFILGELHQYISSFSPYAPIILLAIVVSIIVIAQLINYIQKK
jgi:uncharacterized membrane protein